jgi:hypothetical protein
MSGRADLVELERLNGLSIDAHPRLRVSFHSEGLLRKPYDKRRPPAGCDRIASIRVLEKCGFTISGEDKGFSNASGEEVEEFVLKLEANERSEKLSMA